MLKSSFILIALIGVYGISKAETQSAFTKSLKTYYDESENPLRKNFIAFIDLTNNFIDTCLPLRGDFGLLLIITNILRYFFYNLIF